MKRTIYIVLFSVLGIILQLLAHALIEMWYINLLLADFPRYGFGLTWETWVLIHNILTVVFFVAGAWIGYKEGIYWWRKIYEENLIAEWKKKEIPVKWLIITFIFLFVGSAYWYYVDDVKPYLNKNKGSQIYIEDQEWMRQQVILQRERERQEALRVEAETAAWQTYRNDEFGFEFNYPKIFNIKERDILEPHMQYPAHLIDLNGPDGFGLSIDIYWTDETVLACPLGTHEIECSEIKNEFGVKYIREISTGQLEYDKLQTLYAYIKQYSGRFYEVDFVTGLTNIDGLDLPKKEEKIKYFNQILSTFKFLE